jgi:hypothetical protein
LEKIDVSHNRNFLIRADGFRQLVELISSSTSSPESLKLLRRFAFFLTVDANSETNATLVFNHLMIKHFSFSRSHGKVSLAVVTLLHLLDSILSEFRSISLSLELMIPAVLTTSGLAQSTLIGLLLSHLDCQMLYPLMLVLKTVEKSEEVGQHLYEFWANSISDRHHAFQIQRTTLPMIYFLGRAVLVTFVDSLSDLSICCLENMTSLPAWSYDHVLEMLFMVASQSEYTMFMIFDGFETVPDPTRLCNFMIHFLKKSISLQDWANFERFFAAIMANPVVPENRLSVIVLCLLGFTLNGAWCSVRCSCFVFLSVPWSWDVTNSILAHSSSSLRRSLGSSSA